MRIITLYFTLLLYSIAFGQELNKQIIGDLQKKVNLLETEIRIKTDSMNFIKKEIKHLENQEYLAKFNPKGDKLVMIASLKMEGKLRKSSSVMSEIITIINKNDTVKLTDYLNGYWIVNINQYFGYLSDLCINETDEVKVFKEELIRINEDFRIKKEKEESDKLRLENKKQSDIQNQKDDEYRKKIINKFGKEIWQKLMDGYYWIGMTDKMANVSLGEPRSINRTVGTWGVHEQWIYYSIYLYFEDGILTSYQVSR